MTPNKSSARRSFCLPAFIMFCSWAPYAYAYIDPGSGALLLQLLLAGAIGLVFKLRESLQAIWHSIRSRFD